MTAFKLFVTPDKGDTELTAKLKLADGTVVKASDPVRFVAKAGRADYLYDYIKSGNNALFGGTSSDGKTIDANGAADVVFTYQPDYTVFSADKPWETGSTFYGKRIYDSIDLSQPLPPYAKFDADKNPGWTYDAQSNTAHFTLGPDQYNSYQLYDEVRLKLTFPGASLKAFYTATSSMTFHLKDRGANETDPTVSKKFNYRFMPRTTEVTLPASKWFLTDVSDKTSTIIPEVTNVASRTNKGFRWGFDIANTTADPITITEVRDFNLDPRLAYSYIKINDAPNNFLTGADAVRSISGVKVSALMADGTTKELGTVRTYQTLRFGEDGKNIKELYIALPDGYQLAGKKLVPIEIGTVARENLVVAGNDTDIYANSMRYEAQGTGANGDYHYTAAPVPAKFRLVDQKIDIGFSKELSDKLSTGWFSSTADSPVRADGEKAIWELETPFDDAVKGLDSSTEITNLEIVDLLPEGATYKTVNFPGWLVQRPDSVTHYDNYNDTNLEAVVLHWDSITAGKFNNFMKNGGAEIVTEVTSKSLPGDNTNYVFVKLNGRFVLSTDPSHMGGLGAIRSVQDVRDINNNGNTTERLAATSASYKYTGKSEIVAREYIARANKDNFTTQGLKTGKDTDFRYKLFTYNNKQDMTDFQIVSVLPHVGDRQAAADAGTGAANPRNSQFSNTLTGPVRFSAASRGYKYEVHYSVDSPTTESGEAVTNPADTLTWSTNVTDYSKVTAIKIKLKSGQKFTKGETLEALVPMRAPSDAQFTNRAYSDFAISSNGTEWVPTNMVYNEIYVPSSTVKIVKKNLKREPVPGATFEITPVDGGTAPAAARVARAANADTGENTSTSSGLVTQFPYSLTTGEDGTVTATLPLGSYKVVETAAPEGYVADPTPQTVEIVEDEEAVLEFVNTYAPISVTAKKVWENGPATHPSIQLQLYRDGVAQGSPVTLANGTTTYTWSNLDKTDAQGTEYNYTVDEVAAPENYTKKVEAGDTEHSFVITNSYVSPKIEVTGTKKWVDGPAKHPDIQLQLLRDGTAFGDPVTLKDGEISHTWSNLDKTDTTGRDYVYTVDEVEVPTNYEKGVNGLTVTNTYVSPKTDVTATKVWKGGPAVRPSIKLQLMRDGVAFGNPVELDGATTSYTWKDVDQTDSTGRNYAYSVDEVDVPDNYTKSVDGLTVTNTYVSPKIDITGTKQWVDGPAEHPEVKLQLMRDGEAFGDPVALSNGETSYTWTGLDKTDGNGKAYSYTIDEPQVPENYTKSVDGLTITNTYTPPKADVVAIKKWEGGPKEKPTIKLQLFRNGEAYLDPVELKSGETSYTWKDLEQTDHTGAAYSFTVDELEVPENYEKSVDGLTVTNTYTPPEEPTTPQSPDKPDNPNTEQGKKPTPKASNTPITGDQAASGATLALMLLAGVGISLQAARMRKKQR